MMGIWLNEPGARQVPDWGTKCYPHPAALPIRCAEEVRGNDLSPWGTGWRQRALIHGGGKCSFTNGNNADANHVDAPAVVAWTCMLLLHYTLGKDLNCPVLAYAYCGI